MSGSFIMVAPNGARKTRSDHPSLPITPAEVAQNARECLDAGATAIHLHARDANGHHTLDPQIYQTFIDACRDAVGDNLVIQITTEAVGVYTAVDQMASVRALRPQAVSLAIRELFAQPEGAGHEGAGPEHGRHERESEPSAFLREIAEWGCSPQFILYDAADAFRFAELVGNGVIPQKNPSAIFVLGRYLTPGEQTEPMDLVSFLNDWPKSWPWTLCAFGETEMRALTAAVCLGGHARIGFENNHHRSDGSVASNNAERVRSLATAMEAAGCQRLDLAATRSVSKPPPWFDFFVLGRFF